MEVWIRLNIAFLTWVYFLPEDWVAILTFAISGDWANFCLPSDSGNFMFSDAEKNSKSLYSKLGK